MSIESVSDNTLKNDVIQYKKLLKKTFTLTVHIRIEALEHRADKVFESFRNDELALRPYQYAPFARYIKIFGGRNTEEYFDKLQKMADFDVRESAAYDERTWYQKLFNIDPNAIKYMPSAVMEKKLKRYIMDMRRLENSQYAETFAYVRGEKARAEAEDYIKAYLEDKIAVKAEDAEMFSRYVKTMFYPIYAGCIAEKALNKLKNDNFTEVNVVKEKPKAKFINIKTPSRRSLLQWGKAAVVGAVTVISSIVLFNANKDANGMPVQKYTPKTAKTIKKSQPSAANQKKMITLAEAKKQTEAKTMFADTLVAKDYTTPQAVKDHHDYILKKRLGKKQRDKLYDQVMEQVRNEKFALPAGMTFHEFAYAFAMYRAYGVKSSLANALKSQTKLTAEQNTQVVKDIIAAGYNGVGVKKMADKLHKNINLKQWRQAKKQAGLAA